MPGQMKIGVCHAVTLPGTWEDAIAQAGELGFAGIELFVWPADVPVLTEQPERFAALRKAAQSAGVALPSLGLIYPARDYKLGDLDPAGRARAVAATKLGLVRCAELGGKIALVAGSPKGDDAPALTAYVTSLRELAPEAESLGLTIGIETGLNSEQTLNVLARVGSTAVVDYFDTGNAAGQGLDPVAELRARAGKVCQLHMKGLGGASIDSGTVDFAGVRSALEAGGFTGWLMLETSAGDKPLEAARANLAALRSYFAG